MHHPAWSVRIPRGGADEMRSVAMLGVAVLICIILLGCAASPNELANSPNEKGDVAGFWLGLWHGFIVLFTFIVSLFSDKVHIYEVHNSGGWYNLGFLLGMMIFFCGGGRQARRRSRKR
jgi:hypothetical protein